MNLWAFTALLIAAVTAALSLTDWSSPATPFLTGLAIVFALLSVGALGAERFRH